MHISVNTANFVAPLTQDGVLNVFKPSDWTSHDVVEKIRRALGIRKVGHAGTLDPAATGVLPILLGKGTKLSEYLMDWDKEYEGVLCLGQETDTQDATGKIIQESSILGINEGDIRSVFAKFCGNLEQIPPLYSALKFEGQPLYKLARAGRMVPRQPRSIMIYRLAVMTIQGAEVSFSVTCSKGTYIRTLCTDIGRELGVGGHLSRLKRVRVGPLHMEHALSPLEIRREILSTESGACFLSLDSALSHVPAVTIDSSMLVKASNGVAVPRAKVFPENNSLGREGDIDALVRVKDAGGQLLGIGRYSALGARFSEKWDHLQMIKIFGVPQKT